MKTDTSTEPTALTAEELIAVHLSRVGKPESKALPANSYRNPETLADSHLHPKPSKPL